MPFGANLTGEEGEAERGDGVRITSNAFSVLGVRAALGRTLTAEDDDPKKEPAAVLTYGHFLRRFGGDPKVLGRAIVLNGQSHMVKGVLPRDFLFPNVPAELFVPLAPATDPRRTTAEAQTVVVIDESLAPLLRKGGPGRGPPEARLGRSRAGRGDDRGRGRGRQALRDRGGSPLNIVSAGRPGQALAGSVCPQPCREDSGPAPPGRPAAPRGSRGSARGRLPAQDPRQPDEHVPLSLPAGCNVRFSSSSRQPRSSWPRTGSMR